MSEQESGRLPGLSIVVAVFNGESSIGAFVAACDAVLTDLPVASHEFVFVDDGSSDATWSVLLELSRTRDDVVAVRLLHNVGKEAALTAGLVAASGDAQIPMDVDLQDPPEVLIDLVREWQAGNDVVLARRSARADGPARRAAARIVYGTPSRGSREDIPVDVGDFRLMSRAVTQRFLTFRERSRYNKGLFALSSSGGSVVEYRRPAGTEGRRSRQSPMRLARLTVDGVVSFITWPLHLLSLLGVVLLVLSVIAVVLGVVLRATNVLEVPGQATVVVLDAASSVLAFQGAVSSGVGWDSVFDTGAALAARSVDPSQGMRAAYEAVPSTSEFYEVLVYQLADAAHGLITRDTALLQPLDPTTYAWQATVTVTMSMLAALALALLVRVALGSWLAAAFAWALLPSLPLWMGMSLVDFKDIPVASGLTLVSVGLALAWTWRGSRGRAAGMTGLVVLGGYMAVGTRGGAYLPLAVLVAGPLLLMVAFARPWSWRLAARAGVMAAVVMVAPLIFVWLTNPAVRAAELHWLKDSIDVARTYPWIGEVRTAGSDLMSDALPWWYVPAWLLAQLPVAATATALGGAVAAALPRVRRRLTTGAGPMTSTPLLVQGGVAARPRRGFGCGALRRHPAPALPAPTLRGTGRGWGSSARRAPALWPAASRMAGTCRRGRRRRRDAVRVGPVVPVHLRPPESVGRSGPRFGGLGARLLGRGRARGRRASHRSRSCSGHGAPRASSRPTVRRCYQGRGPRGRWRRLRRVRLPPVGLAGGTGWLRTDVHDHAGRPSSRVGREVYSLV